MTVLVDVARLVTFMRMVRAGLHIGSGSTFIPMTMRIQVPRNVPFVIVMGAGLLDGLVRHFYLLWLSTFTLGSSGAQLCRTEGIQHYKCVIFLTEKIERVVRRPPQFRQESVGELLLYETNEPSAWVGHLRRPCLFLHQCAEQIFPEINALVTLRLVSCRYPFCKLAFVMQQMLRCDY